jgi:rubrerythrin
MKENERLNALEVALNNELREHDFYLKNAERSSNRVGKALFHQLAKEEMEHHELLKKLHEIWAKNEKWPETVPLKVKETLVTDILDTVAREKEDQADQDDDDLAAIRIAIEFEAEGEAFYAKLRDASTDPKEKEFFAMMSKMEHEHYASLKDTEEFLIDPDAWYEDIEERDN